jgi:hypothetical protein
MPRARTSSNFSANSSKSSRRTENERVVNIHPRVEIEKVPAQLQGLFLRCIAIVQFYRWYSGEITKSSAVVRLLCRFSDAGIAGASTG